MQSPTSFRKTSVSILAKGFVCLYIKVKKLWQKHGMYTTASLTIITEDTIIICMCVLFNMVAGKDVDLYLYILF